MATPLTQQPAMNDAQYQAMTQQYLEDIQRINQQMAYDQQEIELLQTETRRLLTDMQVVLKRIEAR